MLAVDAEPAQTKALEREAQRRRLPITVVLADLESYRIPSDAFDVVMIFNYLDRTRFPDFLRAIRPAGYLLAETFLEEQREQGWGPQSEAHLLKLGELVRLVEPFDVILAREVLDMVGGRPAAIASVLAQRPAD